jgi:hypothetical protein
MHNGLYQNLFRPYAMASWLLQELAGVTHHDNFQRPGDLADEDLAVNQALMLAIDRGINGLSVLG